MQIKINYLVRGKRSGFKSAGAGGFPEPISNLHINRVLWLVAQLEMPSGYGSVQNCHDSAAMSAGILHHVAVLPKQMIQGSLWKLLARMRDTPSHDTKELLRALRDVGWLLGADGSLRHVDNGRLVSGRDIRRELTQSEDGNAPGPGYAGHEAALEWATAFAYAFASAETHAVQAAFAAEWLLNGNTSLESQAYSRILGTEIRSVEAAHRHLPPLADMTMAVYHAFSTNAPAVAKQVLTQVLAKSALQGESFCAELIYRLGTRNYKNWADSVDNRSRYDRTRSAAAEVWASDVVTSLMPENIKRRR